MFDKAFEDKNSVLTISGNKDDRIILKASVLRRTFFLSSHVLNRFG